MVRYWRERKASAPSRMASEIARISGLPVSAREDVTGQEPGDRERGDADPEDDRQYDGRHHATAP